MSKKTIAIIFGGRSSEHEISCISAGGIRESLDSSLYSFELIGISKSGRWVHMSSDSTLEIKDGVLPEVDARAPEIVADIHGFSVDGVKLKIDLVFPILHGPYGEDGTIQGFCEMANLPYVGSGVLASAVAMDKSFAKPIFAAARMKVVPGFVATREDWEASKVAVQSQVDQLGYPVFVKPARGGSSRGTHKVKCAQELAAAITDTYTFDRKAMIEVAVKAREIECAVLEIDGEVRASLVGEIKIGSRFEFYDFEAKYLDGATRIELPAQIPAEISEEIRNSAIRAFKALGCSGFARVDFFYSDNGEIFLNELNTAPGFTSTSAFPKMWAASGVGFSQIINALIAKALTRENGVLGN